MTEIVGPTVTAAIHVPTVQVINPGSEEGCGDDAQE